MGRTSRKTRKTQVWADPGVQGRKEKPIRSVSWVQPGGHMAGNAGVGRMIVTARSIPHPGAATSTAIPLPLSALPRRALAPPPPTPGGTAHSSADGSRLCRRRLPPGAGAGAGEQPLFPPGSPRLPSIQGGPVSSKHPLFLRPST